MSKLYIGIDPDTKESGVACWENKELFNCTTKSFWELIEMLDWTTKCRPKEEVVVVIDAAWLWDKSLFARYDGKSEAVKHKIAAAVGANHQVGKLIAEYCEFHNIKYELHKPVKTKTTPEMCKKITGLDIKSQDVIDACILIYGR
jgi:hypothetical protein